MNDSMIRDISLAEEGLQRIRWVGKFMPALNAVSYTHLTLPTKA